MQSIEPLLTINRQNSKLAIRILSPTFGHLPPAITHQYGLTHRKPYYFFFFMLDGHTRHGVDLQQFDVEKDELLFILPHQIHRLPITKEGTNYIKLGFDEACLSRLPRQYPFLINPFHHQRIHFSASAAIRVKAIFASLLDLLHVVDTDPELILAHLNSLLTEIDTAYFASGKSLADDKLPAYIRFKRFVEDHLTEHPSVEEIAQTLALNTNSLYTIVKRYSGLSPKAFITNRLMLEAKRRLYYGESSTKELAYDLGYNDPDYFSRLFKKVTGQTVATFVQDLSGN